MFSVFRVGEFAHPRVVYSWLELLLWILLFFSCQVITCHDRKCKSQPKIVWWLTVPNLSPSNSQENPWESHNTKQPNRRSTMYLAYKWQHVWSETGIKPWLFGSCRYAWNWCQICSMLNEFVRVTFLPRMISREKQVLTFQDLGYLQKQKPWNHQWMVGVVLQLSPNNHPILPF